VTAHPTARLSALVDGELDGPDRTEAEAHLAACAECRAIVDDLRALAASAAAWPTPAPPVDLWPGVAARLEPRAPGVVSFAPAGAARTAWRAQRVSLTLPQLALAASLLMAVSGAVAWLAGQRGTVQAPPVGPAVVAIAEPGGPAAGADVRIANFADAQYDAAVEDLERVLREQRDLLDPRTVVVLQKNLQAIDAAITEARAALAQDPANTFLNSHLVDARRRKLDLLRRATLITEGD
jgi:negative regulator of sigma E activity